MTSLEVVAVDASPLIIIIDDDRAVREAVERLVLSLRYRAQAFASSGEFLRHAELQSVKCIISDVHPEGGAFPTLLQDMRTCGLQIPTIFITALPSRRLQARLLKAGAMYVLEKPVTIEEITGCIAQAVSSARCPN